MSRRTVTPDLVKCNGWRGSSMPRYGAPTSLIRFEKKLKPPLLAAVQLGRALVVPASAAASNRPLTARAQSPVGSCDMSCRDRWRWACHPCAARLEGGHQSIAAHRRR